MTVTLSSWVKPGDTKGRFRVVAEYPGGTRINVQGGSGSAPPVEVSS